MYQQILLWLQSLFGGTNDPLAILDPAALGDKVKLLDIERMKLVETIDRKESLRVELKSRAKVEVSAKGADTLNARLVELARQISYLDEEIGDKRDHLDQIHQQRRAISQFLRFAERADLMKSYGLDKVLGRHVNLGELERAIESSVSGGVLDTESLGRAENLLRDALASTRSEVCDPNLLKVLGEITSATQPEAHLQVSKEYPAYAAPIDAEVLTILRELESEHAS